MVSFSILYALVMIWLFGWLVRIPYITSSPILNKIRYWRLFLWPTILFAEAVVYWVIRKRNRQVSASWTHCLLMTLAFFLLLFRGALVVLHSPLASRIFYSGGPFYAYWTCVLVAHGFFIAVILRSFSGAAADTKVSSDPTNILDDIAS